MKKGSDTGCSHSKPESQQLRQEKTSNIVENQFKHKTMTWQYVWMNRINHSLVKILLNILKFTSTTCLLEQFSLI